MQDNSFWIFKLRSTSLIHHISANALHKLISLKTVAYQKSYRRLQESQGPEIVNIFQESEDDEGQTHYGASQYH